MKVCLLNDSFPPVIDGVVNVVMNYAQILQKDMAEVMVATPRYPNTDYSDYPYKVIPYNSFDTTKIVKGYRAGNPFDIRELSDMAEFKPDIIHSHCPVASTVLARILRAKTDAPLIFTYHTKFDVDIAKAVRAKFIQKETIRALVNNIDACDEVWVVSQGAGDNLHSLGYQGEYRVMSNGVDFPKGRVSQEEKDQITQEYNLPEDIPVFLFVGRLIKYKGIPLILEALDRLAQTGADFRMLFVGSGPDETELKEQAREYGLYDRNDGKADHCIFVGPVYDREKLRAFNTRADLFLFPSTYDTNGIVVREAAACGLASVLIKGSCAAEGITHDKNGYLIEENANSMFCLLQNACKYPEHIRQVGQNAMDQIYISWEDSVKAAFERYQVLIDKKKCGELSTKKHILAEHFVDHTTELLNNTQQLLQEPRQRFEGMRDNMEEIRDEMKEEFRKIFF